MLIMLIKVKIWIFLNSLQTAWNFKTQDKTYDTWKLLKQKKGNKAVKVKVVVKCQGNVCRIVKGKSYIP